MVIRALILTALTSVCIIVSVLRAQEGDGFFSTIDDLPIMQGLHEAPETIATFDTPAGRIIEVYAEGESMTWLQVSRFYEQTLPQLGWAKGGHNRYRREGERLHIELIGKQPLTIRITLAPE